MEERTSIYIQPIENSQSSLVFSINVNTEGNIETHLFKATPAQVT